MHYNAKITTTSGCPDGAIKVSTKDAFRDLVDSVGEDFAGELINSAIDPEVALERPYALIEDKNQLLRLGFQANQLAGLDKALLIPNRSPDFTTVLYQIKPIWKKPRNGFKYRVPAGAEMIVDVHPRSLKKIDDTDTTLWITEGTKKGDSLVSKGLCAVSILGVATFAKKASRGKELLPCWDHIALKGREVVIVYDADAQTNEQVQRSLSNLRERLTERGAIVKVVYLPEVNGDGKAGVDDFFAIGRSLEDLHSLVTDFYPINVAHANLASDEHFKANVNAMFYLLKTKKWKGKAGKTDRSVLEALIIKASKKRWMVKDGIKLEVSYRHLAERCGLSHRTVYASIERLIGDEIIKKDNRGRGKPYINRYILLSKRVPKQQQSVEMMGVYDLPLSLPSHIVVDLEHLNLRNSTPKKSSKRGVATGTRKVRQGKPEERDGTKRLGKKVEHILKTLLSRGAEHEDVLICDLASDLGLENEGKLKMDLKELEKLRIVVLGQKEVFGRPRDCVRLTSDWLDTVKALKTIAGEDEAAENQRKYHDRQRAAYQEWLMDRDEKRNKYQRWIEAQLNKGNKRR